MANLLLIGGAGYTGRQILDAWLDQPSSQVTVLDNGTGVGGMSRLSEFQNDPRMQIIRDDARDRMRLDDLLRYEAFDHVVQLAHCRGENGSVGCVGLDGARNSNPNRKHRPALR